MAKVLLSLLREGCVSMVVTLFKSANWSGILARFFSYLLKRAMASGSYENVRLIAKRVVEQANYVLAVTEDGVISSDEAEEVVDLTRSLFTAWSNDEGKGVTFAIEKSIQNAVGGVSDGQGK